MNKILWLIVVVTLIHLAGSADDFRNDLNIYIVSSPKLGVDTVCVNQPVNLTCWTDKQVKDITITWHWLSQSKEGTTIIVQATSYEVLYTCNASNICGQIGEAHVTVVADGFPPHVYPTNFPHYILLTEGSNRTLITNITSDLPLSSGYPAWQVSNRDLPSNAVVDNTIIDGVLCNKLLLYDLSYYYNSGNYTITAGNECGTSLAFVYIDVEKACSKCSDSGIKIIGSSQDIITVPGEYIQFKCLVQGNLCSLDLSLTHYWIVNFPPSQKREPILIYDDSTDPYRIAVYSNCKDCCNFTSQLTILSVPPEMSGTIELTCVEHLAAIDPVTQQNTTTLTVLNTPKIISSSGGDICTTVNSSESLHCLFNAATMEGATVVVWLKDHSEISGYDNETKPAPGKDNEIISILNIEEISHKDQGRYTCYCYYNKSLVTSDKQVISDQAAAFVDTNCPAEDKTKLKIIIGPVAGGVGFIFLLIVVLVILYVALRWYKSCNDERQIPVNDPSPASPDNQNHSGNDDNSGHVNNKPTESTRLLPDNRSSHGRTNNSRDETESNETNQAESVK